MIWREKMRPAKFRGLSFFVEASELEGGRRLVVDQFPHRDDPFARDMGRAARRFSVDGYVLGADYLDQKQQLQTALEIAGPGELDHPYYGVKRVAVESYRLRESSREGGIVRFSASFVETPAQPVQPTALVDGVGKLRSAVGAARSALRADFLANYNPGAHLASLQTAVRSATFAIDNARSTITGSVQTIALLKRRVSNLQSSIAGLVEAPGDLFDAFAGIFGVFGSPFALRRVYDFDAGTRPTGSTPERQKETANYDALRWMIQRAALVQAIDLLPDQTLESYEVAVSTRDTFADLLDDQLDKSSDDAFTSLGQVRTELSRAIPGTNAGLAHLLSYTPVVTLPSVVLAHRLYGGVSREQDLVDRNHLRHPGFVPGGAALEVLSE